MLLEHEHQAYRTEGRTRVVRWAALHVDWLLFAEPCS
jgi:hypothetical protein